MGLFRSVSTAKPDIPTEAKTMVHHHHAASPLGISLGVVAGVIALGWAVWLGGIFLLEQAGVDDPAQTWATILICLPVGAFLLYSWNVYRESNQEKHWAHEKEMRRLELEALRLQRTLPIAAGREQRADSDTRLAELVLEIMRQAYRHLEAAGPFQGHERPWSRRGAEAIVLLGLGETAPVGERMAIQARQFLRENEIVVDNQVNTDRYPNLASVRELLSLPLRLPSGS